MRIGGSFLHWKKLSQLELNSSCAYALITCIAAVVAATGEVDTKKVEQQRRALYDILSCVRDVRKRSDRTDAMFEPLKETTAVLHAFGIQLGDVVLKQLENADLRCASCWASIHCHWCADYLRKYSWTAV